MQYINYFIFIILYIIGAGYSTLKKIGDLRKKFPQLEPRMVWMTYKQEEWNTMIVSVIGLVLIEITYFIMHLNHIVLGGFTGQWWFPYAFVVVFGYGGDKIAQKALGSAEQALLRKAENLPGASISTTTVKQETADEVKTEETKPKQP